MVESITTGTANLIGYSAYGYCNKDIQRAQAYISFLSCNQNLPDKERKAIIGFIEDALKAFDQSKKEKKA